MPVDLVEIPEQKQASRELSTQLVTRALAGSNAAFDELYYQTVDELTAWIAYRSYRWDMVDECIQQTYITAHRHLHRFEQNGVFIAWLKGIARNELMKYLDRMRRASDKEAALAQLRYSELDKEQTIENDHLSIRLTSCLKQLGERVRHMVWRRYVEGDAVEVIALQEQRSPNAVSVALHRARQSLRKCVDGDQA